MTRENILLWIRLCNRPPAPSILPGMPLYFFHIRNSERTDDEEGRELPDLAAARAVALEGARELACADIRKGWLNLDHYIDVADEAGAVLLRLTFREAVTIRG